MTIHLQMLGTGDAFSKNYYNNNGLLLAGHKTLLIDCGSTLPLALRHAGKSPSDVDATLITHIHKDHVGGLEALANDYKQNTQRKMPLLLCATLVQPLWEYLSKKELTGVSCPRSLEEMFDLTVLRPDIPFSFSSELTLMLIRTPHIPGSDSYSLLLNDEIFYSADMTFQPELLIKLVRKQGVRMILHDCQLTGAGQVHTTLQELMKLPEDVRRLIYLMHYSDQKPEFEGATGEMQFLVQQKMYEL